MTTVTITKETDTAVTEATVTVATQWSDIKAYEMAQTALDRQAKSIGKVVAVERFEVIESHAAGDGTTSYTVRYF